jgi:hypothetical protein
MNRPILLAALTTLAGAVAPAHAGLSVGSAAYSYSQSFDTLTTAATAQAWVNDSTLAGWNLFISNGNAAPTILGGNGSVNTGSFYSFGAAGSAERALGGTASGGAYFGSPAAGAVAGWIAVSFTNDSGSTLDGFSVGFDGEQWRDGGANNGTPAAQTMVLQYGFGATFAGVATWFTPGGSFDFTSPVFANPTSGAAVDGNTAGKVSGLGGSVAASWAPGETLWIRWVERNDFGNDHGLAIDNFSFSVTAVPEPGQWALLLAGLAAVGFVARRRA